MSGNWQQDLNEYLSNIERHVTASLWRIRSGFKNSDLTFDKMFRKNFLRITNNRISETCDRFEMETITEQRQLSDNESSGFSDLDENGFWSESTCDMDSDHSDFYDEFRSTN